MIRTTTAVALVVLTSLSMVGTASAWDLGGKIPPYHPHAKGQPTSPGDAFYPNVANVDPRAECAATGGTPKRKFDGTDFVWVCVQ